MRGTAQTLSTAGQAGRGTQHEGTPNTYTALAADTPAAPDARGAYAVVVSQKTFADAAWRDVCLELVRRHRASIVTWEKAVGEAQAGSWPERPVMMLLPHRVANVKVVAGEDRKPVVADNFILVPLAGRFGAGEKIEIVFEADRAGPPAKTALP